MRVERVTSADLDSTYCCMKETPLGVNWADYVPKSREWFGASLGKYTDGYHLLDGDKAVGFVYWASSENAMVPYETEPKVACIYCTEMLHDYLHKAYGRLMFDFVKSDLKGQGFKGMLVDASDFKEWMHYELFLKQGFRVIKEHAPFKLMYFPLTRDAVKVRLIELNYKPSKDKVEVTLFSNFACPVGPSMYNLVKNVAQSFGDKVKLVEIPGTFDSIRKYGTSDPLINGKLKLFGPASEETVRKAIQEEIEQFKRVV